MSNYRRTSKPKTEHIKKGFTVFQKTIATIGSILGLITATITIMNAMVRKSCGSSIRMCSALMEMALSRSKRAGLALTSRTSNFSMLGGQIRRVLTLRGFRLRQLPLASAHANDHSQCEYGRRDYVETLLWRCSSLPELPCEQSTIRPCAAADSTGISSRMSFMAFATDSAS